MNFEYTTEETNRMLNQSSNELNVETAILDVLQISAENGVSEFTYTVKNGGYNYSIAVSKDIFAN